MTENQQLYNKIIKLSEFVESIGCQPIQDELLSTANYLKEFIDECSKYDEELNQ
jgi:hypothetical protein